MQVRPYKSHSFKKKGKWYFDVAFEIIQNAQFTIL